MIEFDTSELDGFAADLGQSSARVTRNVQKAVEVTARKVKDDARKFATGINYARNYPRSINYDIRYKLPFEVSAAIGPDKNGPQGALGNILEYGSVNNAPVKHLGPALDKNEQDFVDGLMKAVEDSL